MTLRTLIGFTIVFLVLWVGFAVWHEMDRSVEIPALLGGLLTTGFGAVVTVATADLLQKQKSEREKTNG